MNQRSPFGGAPPPGPGRRLRAVSGLQLRAVDVLPTPASLGDEARTGVAWLGHHVRIIAPRDIPEGERTGAAREVDVDGASRKPATPPDTADRVVRSSDYRLAALGAFVSIETTASPSDTDVLPKSRSGGGRDTNLTQDCVKRCKLTPENERCKTSITLRFCPKLLMDALRPRVHALLRHLARGTDKTPSPWETMLSAGPFSTLRNPIFHRCDLGLRVTASLLTSRLPARWPSPSRAADIASLGRRTGLQPAALTLAR